MTDHDQVLSRSRNAEPLSKESQMLLIDLREAPEDDRQLISAAFARSLTPKQQEAAVALMEVVDDGEAFRWF